MFVCSIPLVAIAGGLATALPFALEPKTAGWYLLVLVFSPGWLLSRLIETSLPPAGSFDFRELLNAFVANFVYWFVLVFGFVLWSDKRWRRKRAARIDA
jgi:ABC-type transport system involved in multi-copper enzyme maturation permease subunit